MPSSTSVASLVSEFTSQLEGLIEQMVAERVARSLTELRFAVLAPGVSEQRTVRTARVARVVSRVPPPLTPRPLVELPKPKAATVIPPEVPITRLPPGPMPRESTYSKLRAQCRLPGCLNKNSGPRFDLFCRDHYASLSREEREKYKAQWKVAHASV